MSSNCDVDQHPNYVPALHPKQDPPPMGIFDLRRPRGGTLHTRSDRSASGQRWWLPRRPARSISKRSTSLLRVTVQTLNSRSSTPPRTVSERQFIRSGPFASGRLGQDRQGTVERPGRTMRGPCTAARSRRVGHYPVAEIVPDTQPNHVICRGALAARADRRLSNRPTATLSGAVAC
jgi:hypothetical protein